MTAREEPPSWEASERDEPPAFIEVFVAQALDDMQENRFDTAEALSMIARETWRAAVRRPPRSVT